MAEISRLIILIGVVVSLGACTGEQVPPLLPQVMYHANPAVVTKVQLALRDRGYYPGIVDGYIGQDTADGIQRFQVDHGQRVKSITDPPLLVSLGIASDD
jgi:Putative peptidoglycan binding domain